MALIEIDGLPVRNGWIFRGELLNNQRVYSVYIYIHHICCNTIYIHNYISYPIMRKKKKKAFLSHALLL